MGRAMQGGTALRNLKCVQLKSRVGICQRVIVQGAYLQRAALQLSFGHYYRYAKVAELKKTLRVEQFAEESERS